MSTIDWGKIDKFYIVLAFVMMLMAVLVIFTFNSIFSAFNTAYEVDQGGVAVDLRVDKAKLDEVYTWVFNRETEPLRIR